MKTLNKFIFLLASMVLIVNCDIKAQTNIKELSVFQINIWKEGSEVPGAFDAKVAEIIKLNPDVILMCEISNRNNSPFIPKLVDALKKKGLTYYGQKNTSLSVGVISKYPFIDEALVEYEDKRRPILKAKLRLSEKQTATIYSAHLDYQNYACFLPRGYDGTTWKKMEEPITDGELVAKANRLSSRDEAIRAVIHDVKENENLQNSIIILGGDFNEPSHLDWQDDTKDLYDHNGAIVNWDCSVLLSQFGFKDSFREKYPNPVTHPGFTFPSDNKSVDVSKLAWAPNADERDRIDYIYYIRNKHIKLKSITIVGPSETIVRGLRTKNDSQDVFNLPIDIWPTDHKALFATFKIK